MAATKQKPNSHSALIENSIQRHSADKGHTTHMYVYIYWMMWTDAYHESVAVLDEDVPGTAVAFEESLQIAFPHAVGQTAHVNS